MNRRGAAPGATRERRGEEKRVNGAKAGLSRGQRHTETETGADGAPCPSGGHLRDSSLCDCLIWAKAAMCMMDGTEQDRSGQQVGLACGV